MSTPKEFVSEGATRPVVVVGASAGAVEILRILLGGLPEAYPLSIVVVVHIPPDKKSVLAELFGSMCRLRAVEAEDKQQLEPGTVYFAPPDYHVLVEQDRRLSLSSEEPVNYSRPAIDVLFESAADALGSAAIGIILTGGNHDGARGLRAISESGGVTLIQSPDEAPVPTMPYAAQEAVPKARTMLVSEIVAYLRSLIEET